MGFARLRARLDGLESHAHATMAGADELISLARALVDDLQDGVGVSVHIDKDAAKSLVFLLTGNPGRLPLTVQVEPTVDVFPGEYCLFTGGSHDGKRYRLSPKQRRRRVIVLDPGEVYAWDGREFVFEGESATQQVE
jgi:hypothetical protein